MKQRRERAHAVFRGVVVRVDTTAAAIVARLAVSTIWKGPVRDTVAVRLRESLATESSCDLHLVAGEEYVVFAHDTASGLSTRQCTGTEAANAATSALKVLGPGWVRRP